MVLQHMRTSVIAMAGDKVLMSPVSVIMIHNPLTMVLVTIMKWRKLLNARRGKGKYNQCL